MSVIPNTVCRRCHREYPVYRGKCPYCGTRKPREVRRSLPESDSAVRGTGAARSAAEAMRWQMIIGGILLLCVVAAVIALVSVNMSARVREAEDLAAAELLQEDTAQAESTAIPVPTPVPTPSPTPKPTVTSISIYEQGGGQVDGADRGFMELAGTQVQLVAQVYPLIDDVEVTWSSTDESVAVVTDDGLVTVLGGYGTSCQIIAAVGSVQASCPVWGR